MTSELQFKLLELLQPVLSQEKAREVVFTIEKAIDNQVATHPEIVMKSDYAELRADIKELKIEFTKELKDSTNRINDRIEKLVYFVIGQFIALVSIMFAIAKLV